MNDTLILLILFCITIHIPVLTGIIDILLNKENENENI